MLTAYIDESMGQDDAHVVLAGFMGNDRSWNTCMRKWRSTLAEHNRTCLHMKELRGWKKDRNKPMLAALGAIPQDSGLRLIYGSVNVGDYQDLTENKFLAILTDGYMAALHVVLERALSSVPLGQRLKVVGEEIPRYSYRRSIVFRAIQKDPRFQSHSGIPKLAAFESQPKSSILEPADYAAYAKLQQLIDPNSRKAQLCAPILQNRLVTGRSLDKEHSREMIAVGKRSFPLLSEMPASNAEASKLLRHLEELERDA